MVEQTIAPRKSARLRWNWRWLPFLAAGLIFFAVLAFATLQPVKVLPRIRLSPAFALTDQTAQLLTSEDLRGQIVIYGFGFNRCGAPCADVEEAMQAVKETLARETTDGVPVQLVLVSVDPERDGPDQLAAYSERLGADPQHWRVATGESASLKDIVGGGFEVFYGLSRDGQFELEPAVVLADGAGIIRREYRAHDAAGLPDAERLMRDVAVLQQEARSEGMGRLAYEAAHLFVCYAP